MRRDTFPHLVNTSINQTLARTIITSGTTGGAVLALYLLGGEVLRGFAFTMLVGIVSGTYSTIFVASIIAIVITERRAVRAQRAGATPAAPGAQTVSPSRPRRRQPKARAS